MSTRDSTPRVYIEYRSEGEMHTRILVKEAPVECRFGLVDTEDAQQGSERVICNVNNRVLPKLEDYVKVAEVPETRGKRGGGKTTAKKERRRFRKLFKSFFKKSSKVAPIQVAEFEGKDDTGKEVDKTENNQPQSSCSVQENITSPKTLYTRESDRNVPDVDGVSIVGVDAVYQHDHRKETLFNIFGECFGIFKLNKVKDDEGMYVCGIQATLETPEIDDHELQRRESENSIKTVKRSVPYINLHDTRGFPLKRLGSDSSVSSTESDGPRPGPSSATPAKSKKPIMTKKDAKVFWERIKNMELVKHSNKLPPLKKGCRYFEVQNEGSRPCTPKPQTPSRAVRKSGKTADLATRLANANERRTSALRSRTENAGRCNLPRTNIVQLQMTAKQEDLRQRILERENRLKETQEREKAARELKKQEEERKRGEKLQAKAEQERCETENKRIRMLEREALSDGRKSAMAVSRSEKKREREAKRERIIMTNAERQQARIEKIKKKQKEKAEMADGRRSSMLESRQQKLRKHHRKVDVIQKKFIRPAHIRAIDIPMEPTEYPVEDGIEGEPRPTSPDDYRWTPTPPVPEMPAILLDSDDESNQRTATPGPVLIDGEDPTDFFLKDDPMEAREQGDGQEEEDNRSNETGGDQQKFGRSIEMIDGASNMNFANSKVQAKQNVENKPDCGSSGGNGAGAEIKIAMNARKAGVGAEAGGTGAEIGSAEAEIGTVAYTGVMTVSGFGENVPGEGHIDVYLGDGVVSTGVIDAGGHVGVEQDGGEVVGGEEKFQC